ncbi:MAG TPA: CHAT domain-containing protein [Blastocatellia bacterium]|nr:CHAT domain-containing protein [Blastocatellia bacterium]
MKLVRLCFFLMIAMAQCSLAWPAAHQAAARDKEPREVTGQDRAAADSLFREAETLRARSDEVSQRVAREKYLEALARWQAIGDRLMEATTLLNLGSVSHNLSEAAEAIRYFEQALPIWRALGHTRGEAQTLNNIGWANVSFGEWRRSLDYYNQALPLRRAAGDRRGEAQTLTNIGAAYDALGEPNRAIDHYGRAIDLARDIGDRGIEAYVLSNLSLLYRHTGETQKALEYANQALPLWREVGNRYGEADALNTAGMVSDVLGDYDTALDQYDQALKLWQATGHRYGEAQVLNNIGVVHYWKKDYQTALDYYTRSLVIRRAVGDKIGEAATISNIGLMYVGRGEYVKALEYFEQALTVYKAIRGLRGEALSLANIGHSLVSVGEGQKALDYLNRALSLSRRLRDRGLEANSLGGIARAHRVLGNYSEARAQMEASLEIIESMRADLTAGDFRTSYFASERKYYDSYIWFLMTLDQSQPGRGYGAAAFEASERARARSLLDSLAETRASIWRGINPDLLARERNLRRQLRAGESRRTGLLAGKHTEEQIGELDKGISDLLADYQEARTRIRASSPGYAALTDPIPLTLSEIQQQVLDEDTLLLEYTLGQTDSFLSAVTDKSITCFKLPKADQIEGEARRAYELLTLSHKRQQKREAERAAADLSTLLLGPVAGQLAKKRLLIIADGILQHIPFAALPHPEPVNHGGGSTSQALTKYRPLIADHEIVGLPSASVLALMRRDRVTRNQPSGLVAVFADPVLQQDDDRVRRAASNRARSDQTAPVQRQANGDLLRSANETGLESLERLRFTREEADGILALARDAKNLRALDFDASRAMATSSQLSDYRIVHFATHGLINNTHPELSGLVLSLIDEQGNPQDGFLRLRDIYNLKLGADLVVLSACRTALGKQIRGEGLIGLVRGFMYAGAPRVVASLWDVKDEATSELMKRFYDRMLKGNLRPAAALRSAQLSMLSDSRWEAPYYWAAFSLQGEWK